MQIFQFVAILIHIVAVIVWIGGMTFLGFVLVPALRKSVAPREYSVLMRTTGRRFRVIGWICLLLLLGTGVTNLSRWGVDVSRVRSADFWASTWGQILAVKLALVGVVIVISALHDFVVGPRASSRLQQSPSAREALRLRRLASWMGRANLVIALIIVAHAIMLVRGPPV